MQQTAIKLGRFYRLHRGGLTVRVETLEQAGEAWRCWVPATGETIWAAARNLSQISDEDPDLDAGTGDPGLHVRERNDVG